jgi:cyclopropane-fatty-acyl-phospholipid synthase
MEITSPEIYEMYMRYITGCADRYRSGKIDVVQISLRKTE